MAFYNDEAFNGSPGGQLLISLDTGGIGIKLATTEVTAVANMLRVVDAVENIQSSIDMGEAALGQHRRSAHQLLQLAIEDLDDAVEVLEGAGLHPEAVTELEAATDPIGKARHAFIGIIRNILTIGAIRKAEHARALMVAN